MSARELVGYDLAGPLTWAALPLLPATDPRWAVGLREVAETLTDGAAAAQRCEQVLAVAQPGYVEQGHQAVFVWVADPADGTPTGVLAVQLLVHDAGDGLARPEIFEASLPVAEDRPEMLRHEVGRERLPAGEAVVVGALMHDPRGDLEESVTYVVFPDGSADALELAFATGDLHLADVLLEDAATIVGSLTVTLGDEVGG